MGARGARAPGPPPGSATDKTSMHISVATLLIFLYVCHSSKVNCDLGQEWVVPTYPTPLLWSMGQRGCCPNVLLLRWDPFFYIFKNHVHYIRRFKRHGKIILLKHCFCLIVSNLLPKLIMSEVSLQIYYQKSPIVVLFTKYDGKF